MTTKHIPSRCMVTLLCLATAAAWPPWPKTTHRPITCPYIASCTCAPDWKGYPRVAIDCTNKHLTSLPALRHVANNDTYTINLSENVITTLVAGHIPGRVEELRILQNPLTSIADDALDESSDTLETLVLMNTDLTSIPAAIGGLTAVKFLYLNYNSKLVDANFTFPTSTMDLYINQNALTELPNTIAQLSLRTFQAQFNQITSIDSIVFPSSVKTLELYNNQIHSIGAVQFYNNTSTCISLSLFNNPLGTISAGAFDALTELQTLSLAETRLHRFPLALTELASLNYLNLWSHRPIMVCTCAESAAATWYHHMTNVTSLRIDGKCGHTDIVYFFDVLSPSCPPP